MEWKFYGRQAELKSLRAILDRRRWFFAKITGRRRIGKTRLIQQALSQVGNRSVFYVQIPDSAPSGVVAAVHDAMETFQVHAEIERPKDLLSLAKFISALIRNGYIVVLDEFQYFNRSKLKEFGSFLQHEIDQLLLQPKEGDGGLFVLGSIHTEMMALLEDRSAPLYNRTTDEVAITHWELSSVLEIFDEFDVTDPKMILFFWNLFEGIPKFYRDCFEQDTLRSDRKELLRKMFFESSSPLRAEADNWFLKELHGRYDTILKYIARNSGCTHTDLFAHMNEISRDKTEQISVYLQTLQNKYQIIEKKLPIFAPAKAKKGRYYIADNFLRCWLGALSASVSATHFSPLDRLIQQADEKLMGVEGAGFEKMITTLYEERSRKGIGDFPLSHQIKGFWDRSDIEIDLVAINELDSKIRFATCKRSQDKINADLPNLLLASEKFLREFPAYKSWQVEYAAITPQFSPEVRTHVLQKGFIAEDLSDLFTGLR